MIVLTCIYMYKLQSLLFHFIHLLCLRQILMLNGIQYSDLAPGIGSHRFDPKSRLLQSCAEVGCAALSLVLYSTEDQGLQLRSHSATMQLTCQAVYQQGWAGHDRGSPSKNLTNNSPMLPAAQILLSQNC